VPPVSSRSARDDAQYLNDEAGMPADSTIAAHFNNRDFGTSRRQLSINATRNCCGAGGGSWTLTAAPGTARRGRYWVKTGHGSQRSARRFVTHDVTSAPQIGAVRNTPSYGLV
jgi:hypothetical protein